MGRYRFGDGINEQGLAISSHYFTGEASYCKHKRYGYFNLAPEEFIVWVLGFVKNCGFKAKGSTYQYIK